MYKEIVHSLPCDHEDYADHCLLMMEAMTEVGDREDAREALESLRLLIDQEKVLGQDGRAYVHGSLLQQPQ